MGYVPCSMGTTKKHWEKKKKKEKGKIIFKKLNPCNNECHCKCQLVRVKTHN